MSKFKFFSKSSNRSLQIVTILELALIFASLVLSLMYVKYELSYDRFYTNAPRLVRITQTLSDNSMTECRLWDNELDNVFEKTPNIEQVVKLFRIYSITLTNGDSKEVEKNVLLASPNFFSAMGYPLHVGDIKTALDAPNKITVSESFAKKRWGNESPIGKEIRFEDNQRVNAENGFIVSGVFPDFPDNAHFHTNIILPMEKESKNLVFTYLLLKNGAEDIASTENSLTNSFNAMITDKTVSLNIELMPITDIHLNSRCLRELEPNGNISYIYLVIGANILLTILVFINLWINGGLLFSSRKRYYQLLRLNGAPRFEIIKKETLLSLITAILAIGLGIIIALILISPLTISTTAITLSELLLLLLLFLTATVFVSILPALFNLSITIFNNGKIDLLPSRKSLSGVHFLLTVQYVVVMIIVILAFGIGKQISLIMTEQVGANDSSIIVISEQPSAVKENFPLLKAEFDKYPEVEGLTASMQLPGDGIRDAAQVKVDDKAEEIDMRILVVENDFFPFFQIPLLAGKNFAPDKLTLRQHLDYIINVQTGNATPTDLTEEYIINKKAMADLGFNTPEEAIGHTLRIGSSSMLSYIPEGKICGVADNFVYTSVFEENIPLLIFQRSIFNNCFMVKLNDKDMKKSLEAAEKAWKNVNPDFPFDYSFLKDNYAMVYKSELGAENLVNLFSLLCLLITNLCLLVFVSFVIKKRRREIAIRRVNGATIWQIVKMLNMDYIRWIAVAFVVSIPVSYYILQQWQQSFMYKATLSWLMFALAGIAVLLISVAVVSYQTWRAARANPVEALRGE